MSTPTARPPRRLRHRVPLRLRQHWKPLALLCAGLTVLLVFFGDARITPYITSASATDSDTVTENITGTVGLYDESVPHSIQLEYDEDDFDKMMEKFAEEGEKEYIQADATVDGVFITEVGIRLKGNSTLQSLRAGGGRGGATAGGPGNGAEEGVQEQPSPEGDATEGREQGQRVGGGAGVSLSPDEPEELPWLIKIDEYVEGRAYQGHRQIAVRPGSNAELPLNEAVSLSLMATSEQPAQRYAFSTLTVNNRPAATRLLVENPGADYAEQAVGTNGVLYKSLSTGTFSYKGEDPTEYESDFKQLTKEGSQDLQPVIDLVEWVDESSDEEFAAGLGDRIDLESFARYVATQNLLLNFDDMSGPGKNYYLWYDLDTKKFSVLGWDFNLTFGGDTARGPDDDLGVGGGQRTVTAPDAANGAQQVPDGAPATGGQAGDAPEGLMPPGGVRGGEGAPEGGPAGAGGGMRTGHTLKERFLGLPAFDEVYESAYRDLYQVYFASGTALDALEAVTGRAEAAGADSAGISTASETLRTTIEARTKSLAENEVVAGKAAAAN